MAKTSGKSEWRDFLFVGNHPALDFLNTRPVQDGQPQELLPDFAALLRWFQAAELLSAAQAMKLQKEWAQSERAANMLDEARHLREMLRLDVIAWEGAAGIRRATLEGLNRLAAIHPMRTRLQMKGKRHEAVLWFDAGEPEGLFAPLAHSAIELFAEVDHRKVRKCGNCVLHFHDTSKKGTRRWCSMQLCGNRLKVAAYAARQRLRN
jgi:predicted RNA-binding Zn ribbon-like protein